MLLLIKAEFFWVSQNLLAEGELPLHVLQVPVMHVLIMADNIISTGRRLRKPIVCGLLWGNMCCVSWNNLDMTL